MTLKYVEGDKFASVAEGKVTLVRFGFNFVSFSFFFDLFNASEPQLCVDLKQEG